MSGRVTEWRGRGELMFLGGIAGVLFVIEGFYLAANTSVSVPFGSVTLPAAGALSSVAGVALVLLSALYRGYGSYRAYLGTLVLLVAAGNLWFGGGFYVGTILGTIAGTLMIALPPYPIVFTPE